MKNLSRHLFFVKNLLLWNKETNSRDMPWKGEKDPYKIWLSEIILQQTRVKQGLDYYNRFVKAFPTIGHLAASPETTVFKLWEGLGYYTRCKNLIATAKYITSVHGEKFPDNYDEILALKGIGPYTAAAIGSFAFNLPHAVVDGNVFRVLSRYFGLAVPIDSTGGKKLFSSLAADLLDKNQPGNYNQALMDFGAVICKPQLPLCSECIMKSRCTAFLKGSVHQLPVKEKSVTKKTRWFHYVVLAYKKKVYVRKRGPKDIWENLYEFILIEAERPLLLENLETVKGLLGESKFEVEHISAFYKQLLTHQTIRGRFICLKISEPVALHGYKMVSKTALQKLPFPKFISNYLKDKNVSLNLF
ncbi:MAG: A/G-specific adenine glycosylase [Ferruginibacter sp.]